MDILELIAQKTAKVVFVEDTKTSSLACLTSAVIYFLTSLIPTKVFFSLLALGLFTIPYYYEKHQDVVDEHLQLMQEKSQILIDKYGTVACQHLIVYAKQILDVSVGLGSVLQQRIQKVKNTDVLNASVVSPAEEATITQAKDSSVDAKTEKQ